MTIRFFFGVTVQVVSELLPFVVTVQIPPELLRHTAIWNRFATAVCPPTTTFSHGQRSKCADLSELLPFNIIS